MPVVDFIWKHDTSREVLDTYGDDCGLQDRRFPVLLNGLNLRTLEVRDKPACTVLCQGVAARDW